MNLLERIPLPDDWGALLPWLGLIAALSVGLWCVNWILMSRKGGRELPYGRQIFMLVLTALALLVAVFALPIREETRNQLLTLLGLALTVVVTMSSTTFVANIMAGLMLRAVGSFRMGDFLRIDHQFGRVTERGLFHTEIQTEDRDLTTIPNLVLVSKPFSVVRKSGTVVSAQVSLGYDIHHSEIEKHLLAAARIAELQEPFCHIRDLGDYSITYRVAGFLPEVTRLLSARSRLREAMLDCLHEAGVEIVSPTFMNQRQVSEDAVTAVTEVKTRRRKKDAETLVFDKAEQAERIVTTRREIASLQEERDATKDDGERSRLQGRIDALERSIERIQSSLDADDEA